MIIMLNELNRNKKKVPEAARTTDFCWKLKQIGELPDWKDENVEFAKNWLGCHI